MPSTYLFQFCITINQSCLNSDKSSIHTIWTGSLRSSLADIQTNLHSVISHTTSTFIPLPCMMIYTMQDKLFWSDTSVIREPCFKNCDTVCTWSVVKSTAWAWIQLSHINYSYVFINLITWNSRDCRTLQVQTSKSLNSNQYFIALNKVISSGVLEQSKIWNCCTEKMREQIALHISHSSMQVFISTTGNTHLQTFH